MLQGILLAAMVAEFGSLMCPILAGSVRGMACVIDGLSTKWPAPICRWGHVCMFTCTCMSFVHIYGLLGTHSAVSCCKLQSVWRDVQSRPSRGWYTMAPSCMQMARVKC